MFGVLEDRVRNGNTLCSKTAFIVIHIKANSEAC
jgi:hypothetical protein